MALSLSLPALFGARSEPPLDDAGWLPEAAVHAPPDAASAGFDLAVQARMRRERAQAERAGEGPRLALGGEPMSVGARRVWSLGFLAVGLTLLALGVLNLRSGFSVGWMIALVLGLIVMLVAAHRFLASFNPTLTLLADRDTFAPGDAVEVNWAFSRPVRRAAGFKVVLAGEERATYRQGTSDTTASETFFEETVHEDAGSPTGVPDRGSFVVKIPADAMHSFASDNNAIEWTLTARAPLPWWPDIGRSATLRVWAGPEPVPAREESA